MAAFKQSSCYCARGLLALVSVVFVGLQAPAHAQEAVPLLPTLEGNSATNAEQEIAAGVARRGGVSAAWSALELGYAEFALDAFSQLAQSLESGSLKDDALLGQALSALSLNRPTIAASALSAASDWRDGSLGHFIASMTAYQQDDLALANDAFGNVNYEELPDALRAWYYWHAGMLAEAASQRQEAIQLLNQARDLVKTPEQYTQIELALFKVGILNGDSSAETIRSLQVRLESASGGQLGFQVASLLAAALANTDRLPEALQLLDDQILLVSAAEPAVLGRLLLLKAVLAGPETEQGRRALENIVLRGSSRRYVRIALGKLSQMQGSESGNAGEYLALLNTIAANSQGAGVLDLLLLTRANWYLNSGDLTNAEADASRVIEQFPASDLVSTAHQMLAQIALRYQPPQYRTAAKQLLDLRKRTQGGEARAQLSAWTADCYFLNGDFQSAASTYAQAVEDAPDSAAATANTYQQALALLELQDYEAASALLDTRLPLTEDQRWQAEWNLANGLRKAGRSLAALRRVESLLEQPVEVPPALRLRLEWLNAQIAMTLRTRAELVTVPTKCDDLLATLDGLPEGVIPDDLSTAIRSRTLMLKGQALLALQRVQAGLSLLDELANNYPESDAAVLARLIAARSLAQAGQVVEAQQRMKDLADTFPDNPYAPVALYEAALQAEKRGVEATYRAANDLLVQLQERYPEHELVYYAKLEQGDILRQLNEFEVAERVYQQAIESAPEHPARPRAELSLADCLAAQGGIPAKALAAQDIYELMFENPEYPSEVRAEAGFKRALLLKNAQNGRSTADAFWQVLQTLWLEDGVPGNQQGNDDRAGYWLARAGLELTALWERQQRFGEAHRLYSQMLDAGFPGSALIENRLNRLTQQR